MKKLMTIALLMALLTSGCSMQSANEPRVAEDFGLISTTNSAPAADHAPKQGNAVRATPVASAEGPQQGQQMAQNAVVRERAAEQAIPASAPIPAVPMDRKVIRNGELTLELDDPADAQRRITAIAELLGGFVVTSESKQSVHSGRQSNLNVSVIVRIPSQRFGEAIEKIRAVGARTLYEKMTGQDVTEEFVDVEARMRAKKALEAQVLEIMKRAQRITDALEVQNQLAEVRGQIEVLEGRRRWLENQSALSTITIRLQTPALLVAAAPRGFWHGVGEAFGDGLTVATSVMLSLIRTLAALIPVLALVILPIGLCLWAMWRYVLRRIVRSGWWRKPAPEQAAS
ncbi:MAG: DUF4349 domain-containing protein [Blastocatellia bacterium]